MTQIPQTRPQLPESATGEERGEFSATSDIAGVSLAACRSGRCEGFP